MNNIADRLLASLRFDVTNGSSAEKGVFERQVKEAIDEIRTLNATIVIAEKALQG